MGTLAQANILAVRKSISPESFHSLCLIFQKSLHSLHTTILNIITTQIWIIKELVYCPSNSRPIFLCQQTCHNNMTCCLVYHDIIYLEGFAHGT